VDEEPVQKQLLTVAEAFRDSQSVERFKNRAEKQTEDLKKKIAELNGMKSSLSAMANSDLAPTSTEG
jgi:geranylgeranyl pyrophosphate synthase